MKFEILNYCEQKLQDIRHLVLWILLFSNQALILIIKINIQIVIN